MDRDIIWEVKKAGMEQNWEGLEILAEHFPEEVKHAALEHEVAKLVFQKEDLEDMGLW